MFFFPFSGLSISCKCNHDLAASCAFVLQSITCPLFIVSKSLVYCMTINDAYVGLIQTVEKVQRRCIIKFGETAMRIICNQEEGGVQIWSYVVILSLLFPPANESHHQ